MESIVCWDVKPCSQANTYVLEGNPASTFTEEMFAYICQATLYDIPDYTVSPVHHHEKSLLRMNGTIPLLPSCLRGVHKNNFALI
jgi:hypothetical protein